MQKDCFVVTELPLSLVLLMNDSQYPWTILVPRAEQAKEVIDLSTEQQQQLWCESAWLSRALQQQYHPDKLNIAALGNMVPQLHIHHIVRFKQDAAWPQPVWGKFPPVPYTESEANKQIDAIKTQLENVKEVI
ncbi:HIT domain-containing protein [Lacimicrobium alkaliphilum]|uniref:HIT domain-containing protein n=1 Tax=Lacimicrobium alkaliphilum TaxID=1526571 RepID=UPI003B589CE0